MLNSTDLTVLDYFAGQALAGLLANAQGMLDPAALAKSAYEMATAMLKERERNL